MKFILCFLLALVAIQAQPRRWMAYGSCAASALDLGVTAYAAQHGARELNPIFRTPSGSPSVWRMSVVKAGMCVATIYSARHHNASMLLSVPQLAIYGRATIHDFGQLRNLRQ